MAITTSKEEKQIRQAILIIELETYITVLNNYKWSESTRPGFGKTTNLVFVYNSNTFLFWFTKCNTSEEFQINADCFKMTAEKIRSRSIMLHYSCDIENIAAWIAAFVTMKLP